MLPLADDNPTRTFPVVNYLLLAINVAAFIWEFALQQSGGSALIASQYALVPARFGRDPLAEVGTIFFSMFLHANVAHLGGNLLFLYIFGDNVEDAIGHFRYVLFYLLCGVGAALVQVAADPTSPIPVIGASGAIAGVLGGYLVLYPRARVTAFNPIFLLWPFIGFLLVWPAWAVIGEWFGWNLFSLWRMVGAARDGAQGGVALFAHVGGFVVGLLTVRLARHGRPALAKPVRRTRPGAIHASPAGANERLGAGSSRAGESRWARTPRSW